MRKSKMGKQQKEQACHEYFKYKWGKMGTTQPKENNSKMLDF